MISNFYPAYIKEYKNEEYLETDHGFVCYKYGQDHIYITDVYVVPERRRQHVAFELFDKVAVIAKEAGLKYLLGVVQMNSPDKEASLLVQLKYGAKILEAGPEKIYLWKEI